MFVLMCDNKEITQTIDNENSLPIYKLKEGVPEKYIPKDLFLDRLQVSSLELIKWIEDRVFPEERTDCDTLLKELGLDRYDAWEIAKKTRGTLMTDYFWLKVNEDDKYETHSIRGLAGIPPVQF